MTLKDKRAALDYYCGSVPCRDCVLRNKGWNHTLGGDTCLEFDAATEAEIDRALALINGGCSEKESDNPYWDRITAIANRQRSKGLKEYGRGVEDDTADINVRLDRIEEELIDTLMYLEHLRDGLNRIKEVFG